MVLHDASTPVVPPVVLEQWIQSGRLHNLAALRGWSFVQALLASDLLAWLATQDGTVSDATIQAAVQARLPADVWRRAAAHLAQREADGAGHRCAECRFPGLLD